MSRYLGDFALGQTVRGMFSTGAANGGRVDFSNALEAADVRVYKNGSATQRASEAGYTVTSGFDSMVGAHYFAIDTADNTDAGFFVAGADYSVVLYPDETVDSQSVAAVLAEFSIENRFGSLATLPALSVGAHPQLGILDSGTAQSATGTTIVLRSAATFADDTLNGATIAVYGSTQGYWQTRSITDYVLSTDTATVDTWTVTPSGTITYVVFAGAPGTTADRTAIANAVVEAEIDALETYNRTTNTAATITGPINGATTLTITTDAAYEPIKSIS